MGFAGALGGNNYTIDTSNLGSVENANKRRKAAAQGFGSTPLTGGVRPGVSTGASGGAPPAAGSPLVPQGAAATPPPPSSPLTVQGQSDPAMLEFIKALGTRTAGQQGKENADVSWSAERASDLAARDIYGGAAGAKKRKMEELSERGLSPGRGVGAGQLRSIDEAAATRSARATSDIGLAREKEQDSLNLQREGAVNSLYGALGNFAQVPFQQALQSGNQALNVWQAGDNAALSRARLGEDSRMNTANLQQNQLQNWLSLMRGLS
jgi:hypothetical protein